jgi:uncharacterized membrane protein (DUF2068 family)
MHALAPRGVRLIVAYKLIKGTAEAVFAVTLVALIRAGYEAGLVDLAEHVRHHVAGAWSVKLADLALALSAPRRLWTLVGALSLDATLTLIEGATLRRGAWWAPWLVVVATSALVPFEVAALVRHVHAGRLVILAVNLAIVAYLIRRAVRERARARLRE